MSNKKKKTVMTITAALLVLVLAIAGTYAWSGGEDSDGEIDGTVDVSVRLHDDYDMNQQDRKRDRDIYVENTGDSMLYIRVRLDEYLELGGKKLISGTDKDDKTTWKPHIPDMTDTKHCGAGFHDYFVWEMGNSIPIDYASDVKNWYTGGKPAKTMQTGTATVITMTEYFNTPNSAKPVDCWILDEKDGYAYWGTQLIGKKATGILLNSIEASKDLDETYLYKVNAKLEAVTEIDVASWIAGAETTDGKKMNRASENAGRFLKDISPSYIKITDGMNLTTPAASEFDGDRDGYLTKAENKRYGKETGTVKISETTFTDGAFRNYVSANLDIDGNGMLTQNELQAVTTLDVSNQGITSLKGIENFTNLTDLDCSNNKLISLNLSNNMNLISVTAENQAVEIEIKYEPGIMKYKSAKGLFAEGTTFGEPDVVLDETTGGIIVDTYTVGKTSTYSVPIIYGITKASSNLTGVLTLKEKPAKDIVKEANVGDVVKLRNKDHSLTEWVVLTKSETQAELWTKEMVTAMTFANRGVKTYPKWSGSAVRTYLNGTFYDSLSEDLQSTIKEESLRTPTVYNNFAAMETTVDKVYLLCQGGNYGSGIAAVITPSGKDLMSDAVLKEFLKCELKTTDEIVSGYYWLRSPYKHADFAGIITPHDGAFCTSSCYVTAYPVGVRPALTVNLQ